MDERELEQRFAEEFTRDWNLTLTGNGLLIATDWMWPNRDHIDIYVRTVGDREDLYLVTDGGELYSFLFTQGIDLAKDEYRMKILNRVADNYGAKFVEFQLVKGANEGDLTRAVRMILEAIKDASLLLWHSLEQEGSLH
jgi:hypothetical protein